MSCDSDYKLLINLFVQLVQSQAGKPILQGEEWTHDAQILSFKLFKHLLSMQHLSNGYDFRHSWSNLEPFLDHSSIKVITRAALETYLVFYYLYGSGDRNLSEFRHKTWVLGGLTDRQNLNAVFDEHIKKQIKEKQRVEKLKSEIQSSPYLQQFMKKQQLKMLQGKWRVAYDWTDLAKMAGFNEKYFKNIYGYLCGYSHASYASALQMRQASFAQQKELVNTMMNIGIIIMARFSFCYSKVVIRSDTVLLKNPEAREIAEKWHFSSETLEELFKSKSS